MSQIKSYEQCPHSYFLARIEKVWEKPAAWLPHGTAVHAAIEAWEKSGRTMTLEQAQDVFRVEYARGINEACELTPNFNYWFASGRYRGEEDIPRRYEIGLEMVAKYIAYAARTLVSVWTAPDGTPAIELGFYEDFGGVMMKGFIDQVVEVRLKDGSVVLLVRDVKTGANPGDTFQLKIYSMAILLRFGVEPLHGDYWMGKTGKPTRMFDLSEMSHQEVIDRVHAADEGIKAERFDPKPDPDVCRRCPVATSCRFSA